MTKNVMNGLQLSNEAAAQLKEQADMIECRCPEKLIDLLEAVREFTNYTEGCIEKYPDDRETHKWLRSSAVNIDQLLSMTLVQLARIEGFIDDDLNIVPREGGA